MAVRSFKDRAERVAFRNDRVRLASLKILRSVLAARADDPEQVKKDALLPKGEAPFYLHAATQIGSDSVRRESDERGGPGTTLNVVIMGQAPSKEAWLEAVMQSQQKAIDVVPVPPAATEPKS